MLDQTPSFASVARKIGEPRLERVLGKLAHDVRTEIHNANFVSLRSEVRSDVKQLKTNAERFEKALDRISKRLLDLPIRGHEVLPYARQSLRKVIEYCDESLSIISDKGGVRKQPGRITCATIVIEAWTFIKGKTPRANNPKVQETCDEYWRACGCQPIGGSDPGNWRRAMAEALQRHSRWRDFIRNEIERGTE
jgi:hypothetical protein